MPDATPVVAPTTPAAPKDAAAPSAKAWTQLPDAEFAASLGLPLPSEEGAEEAPPVVEEEVPAPQPLKPVLVPKEQPLEEEKKEEEAVPVEAVVEKRPPLTKFSVYDKDGELEVPELLFSFKASGKAFEQVPLDKVVKFAQMGVYNEEREQEVLAAKQFVPQLQQQVMDLTAALQDVDLKAQRLLEDEDYYLRARNHFAESNTPEMRVARAEQQLQYQQRQYSAQQEAATAHHFLDTQVGPALEHVFKSNPLVNELELLGGYTTLIAPHLEHGRVPLAKLPLVKQMIETQLAETLGTLQAERELTSRTASAASVQAKTEVVRAKRVAARAVAPQGVPGPEARKPTKFGSVNDWVKSGFGGLVPSQDDD